MGRRDAGIVTYGADEYMVILHHGCEGVRRRKETGDAKSQFTSAVNRRVL